jgi:predicted Zn-dependent protease
VAVLLKHHGSGKSLNKLPFGALLPVKYPVCPLAHLAQCQQALVLRQKLADDFPNVTLYQVELGGGLCNYANLLLRGDKPADSLPWYNKAIDTLARVYQQNPEDATARLFLRNSYSGRAIVHHWLKKHAEEAKDWRSAAELTPPPEQPSYRVHLATSLMRAGQMTEAIVELEELTKAGTWPAGQWYDFACLYAQASARSAEKKKAYGDRAMEMLRQAVKAGYNNADRMAKEGAFDVLRGRDDFKTLLGELGAATPSK